MNTDDMPKKASEFIFQMFKEQLPSWAVYHNFDQTAEMVKAAEEIGQNSNLSKSELEVVILAAWFVNARYLADGEQREEKSIATASQFLADNGYPQEKIDQVTACIRSAALSSDPANRMEEVLSDAGIIGVGKKKFLKKAELFRTEKELHRGKHLSDVDWLTELVEYVSAHNFKTKYARSEYARQRTKNLIELQELRRDVIDEHERQQAKLNGKKDKTATPVRGIETMIRLTASNHMHFSGIADHKAGMMISTNSLMITLVATILGRGLFEHDAAVTAKYPAFVIIPVVLLVTTSLTTIILAVISTRPKITSGTFSRDDIDKKRVNLLFFGNFYNMSAEDYEWGMRELMKDGDYLYGMMIRDIHSLGRVLARKFMFLRFSYNVFMFGLIATLLSFLFLYFIS